MTSTSENLLRTPLYALHLELGGKIVPFAGYEMPVQYPAGILKEHLHTREKAGLFDVSHMGQAFLAGDTAALERVTSADVAGLKEGMQRYGLLLTEAGTIKDDFMFSRLAGEADLYLVVNADTKEGDFAYIAETLAGVATLTTPVLDAFVPQMLNYESIGGVNFKKGCYPGQEIVARSQFRGTLKRRAYVVRADAPLAPGEEIFAANDAEQPAGIVVQSAASPAGEWSAIVSMQIAALASGGLRAGGPEGVALTVDPLPYPLLLDI